MIWNALKTSSELEKIAPDFCKFQGEITDADKDTEGYGYKYADLGSFLRIVRPLAAKYNLGIIQSIYSDLDRVGIICRILHSSGQWMEGNFDIKVEGVKGMSYAQAVGSSITYMRKYSVCAMCGLTQIDDDGKSAAPSVKLIDDDMLEHLINLTTTLKISDKTIDAWLEKAQVKSLSQLPYEAAEKLILSLNAKLSKETQNV